MQIRRQLSVEKYCAEINLLKVRAGKYEERFKKIDENMASKIESTFKEETAIQCFAIVRLKKMQTLKIITKFVYKLISFRDMKKNLLIWSMLMILSFSVALTDNQFYPQLIKESSNFVPKASGKICFFLSFLKISKFCIKQFNSELEAVSKQIESVELISKLQNSLGDKMNELQIH